MDSKLHVALLLSFADVYTQATKKVVQEAEDFVKRDREMAAPYLAQIAMGTALAEQFKELAKVEMTKLKEN